MKKTGIKRLCIAGGVGLNSVVNGKILNNTDVEDLHIVPAAGDTGQCLGNALYGYHKICGGRKRYVMENAYLGREYDGALIDEIIETLRESVDGLEIHFFDDFSSLAKVTASSLKDGKILANFQGRSEFGPRALGNRSILMSPCSPENKDILNERVKFRESFRPFAPAIMEEYYSEYFAMEVGNPYMLIVDEVLKPKVIPAVTHIDGSAMVQSVSAKQNLRFHEILSSFAAQTGVPVLLNTSFNISGEPIVESPNDAVSVFLKTNIDCLILDKYFIRKSELFDQDKYLVF